MLLTRIEASGFRNLEGDIQFGPDINIFYGDNAQGKTNWLEAVYVLGNTRSFRTNQLRDCIRFEAERFILRGETVRGSLTKGIQIAASGTSKELFVNGKREVAARYLGNLDVFVFSLEEMDVIRGEPTNRRRFIDRGVVTITPGFVSVLSQYNQVIKQKNRLLAEASQSDNPRSYSDQVEAWNDQMVDLGAQIHLARVDYVDRLNRVLDRNDYGRAIFGGERIGIRYKSQLEGKGNLDQFQELYRARLGLRMTAELAAGHSLIGPHRDELEILADGREVARFGSAGQQRSALLLLDLAQVSIYNSVYEESPTLVIDDIDAELDRSRIEALLSELEGSVQTFISTSRRGIASRYKDRASLFRVEGGRATCETAPDGVQITATDYAEAMVHGVSPEEGQEESRN
jgi:DNA replication and repair protein RecF